MRSNISVGSPIKSRLSSRCCTIRFRNLTFIGHCACVHFSLPCKVWLDCCKPGMKSSLQNVVAMASMCNQIPQPCRPGVALSDTRVLSIFSMVNGLEFTLSSFIILLWSVYTYTCILVPWKRQPFWCTAHFSNWPS